MKAKKTLIEIRTGSDSDIPKIKGVYDFLQSIDVPYLARILSAHRTPQVMAEVARKLSENGFFVSIAAAGGSAHLPGMTASETVLPVVGLPISTSDLGGQDSLYSIIQMPNGIPVGTVGIGQAESAAILAAQIAYNNNSEVRNKIRRYRGLKERLPRNLTNIPLIGIVKPIGIEVDEQKYGEMLSLLKGFGIQIEEYDLSVVDFNGAKVIAQEMANKGAMALITIGALGKEESTNHFPRFISSHTDLPTIGLPIAKGFVGKSSDSGDIFHNMLGSAEPEEGTRGYPVAGMGINRYVNAALYASQIAGLFVPEIQKKLKAYRDNLASSVRLKDAQIQSKGIGAFLK